LHDLVELLDLVGQFDTPFQIWFPQETLPFITGTPGVAKPTVKPTLLIFIQWDALLSRLVVQGDHPCILLYAHVERSQPLKGHGDVERHPSSTGLPQFIAYL
jgi:hypothetical protein